MKNTIFAMQNMVFTGVGTYSGLLCKLRDNYYLMIAAFLFGAQVARAQRTDALGTYTPYSLYGIGDLEQQGNAITKSMGGISAGIKRCQVLTLTWLPLQRDTLSFLFDFGLKSNNIYNKDKKNHSAYNTFNINNFAFSAPIYHKSALVVGIVRSAT